MEYKPKKDQLKAGIVLSYANLLIGNIIPFIYTPIMLRLLGQAEYGLYGIANSVMGYISLLNLGVGGTILRYLSKYRIASDTDGERRIVGLFIKLYGVAAALILAAGVVISFNLNFYDRSLSGEELSKLGTLVRLMAVNTAIFLPFSVFSSISVAHEQFIFSRLLDIISGIASPCICLVMLLMGYGSVGLVLASTVLNLISYPIYTVYAVKRLRIIPSFKKCDAGIIKEIIGFSFFSLLASIVDILYWSTDKLIIGWAIGSVAVAVYNVGATFNGYLTSLSAAMSGMLLPKITEILADDNRERKLTELFIKVGRLQFILVSLIISGFIVFGKQFITIWAGSDYTDAYYVALLTMIPVIVPLIQNTGINIMLAMNKHRFRALVYLAIAMLNVVLTLWLVEKYGIIGAASATCASYIVGNGFIMNRYYYKKIGLDIPLFWKNIAKMMPVMLAFIILGLVMVECIAINSWLIFFICSGLYSVLYLGASYFFMMNEYEKGLIAAFFRKVKSSVGRIIKVRRHEAK